MVIGTTGDQHAQRLGNILGRHAEGAHAVLIDDELQVRRLLIPVEMGIHQLFVVPHDIPHPIGDLAHLFGVGADDSELHGETDRRAKVEPVNAYARFRKRAVRDRLLDACLDPFACLDVLRHDHDLCEGLVRQLRIEANPEAR